MVPFFPLGASFYIDYQPCQGNWFLVALYCSGFLWFCHVRAGRFVRALQNMPPFWEKRYFHPHGPAQLGCHSSFLLYISPADHGPLDGFFSRRIVVPVLYSADGAPDQQEVEWIDLGRAPGVKLPGTLVRDPVHHFPAHLLWQPND